MPKGKILMGKAPGKKPKQTPDPYFLDILPPAEGFGGYGPDNKLTPPRAPATKRPQLVGLSKKKITRRGGK